MWEEKKKKNGIDKYSYKNKDKFSYSALYPISKAFPSVYQTPPHWFN